jgi:hypothetical protein
MTTTDKRTISARITAKVRAMTADQRCVRMQEIVDSPDRNSEENLLEFAKLVTGPDATIVEDDPC